MAEGQSVEQLRQDLSNQLKLSSKDDKELPLHTSLPESKNKRKRRKKKVSYNENNQSETKVETDIEEKTKPRENQTTTDNPENPIIKQKEPKAGKWTKEYVAWESQKRQSVVKGAWSTTGLYPAPKKFVDKPKLEIPMPAKLTSTHNKAKAPENNEGDNAVAGITDVAISLSAASETEQSKLQKKEVYDKRNPSCAGNAKIQENTEIDNVATLNTGLAVCTPVASTSKHKANKKKKPSSKNLSDSTKQALTTDNHNKVDVIVVNTGLAICTPVASTVTEKEPLGVDEKKLHLSKANESANGKGVILGNQTKDFQILRRFVGAVDCAASEMKAVEKVASLPKETQTKQQPIPDDCVQLVIQTQVAPKPKKKQNKNTKDEVVEEAGADRTKSPLTSSEEEEKRPPPRTIKVIVPKKDLDRYRRSGVLSLKHLNEKFPRAIFHCRLCSFHISSLPEVERHLKDTRHKRLQAVEQRKQTAALMPMPSKEITEAIGELVQNVYECSFISKPELEIRMAALGSLQKAIEEAFPCFTIRFYGSTFTGLGLKYSDVNVGLVFMEPKEDPVPGLMIIQVLAWLKSSSVWTDVVEDFSCRVPVIRFKHQQLNVLFALVTDSQNAYKTSSLLKEYQTLDPRFTILTVAFRTFARICRLDQPDYGSLPPHAFTLMVLFYLQQTKILPVLHCAIDDDTYISAKEFQQKINAGEWQPTSKTLGELWLGLLKFYGNTFNYNEHAICVRSFAPVTRSSKNWGSRRLAIEDPYHTKNNLASSLGTTQTYEFFLECMINLFTYFWIPHTAAGPLFTQLVLPGEGSDSGDLILTPAEAKEKMNLLKKEDLKWDFTPDKILQSKQLPLTCSICNAEGHSKHSCPELEVSSAGPLATPDFRYLALLDQVCYNVFRHICQNQADIALREDIRRELERYIRVEYPDAVLTLFGSSCNGFGFTDSDMDVCMTFESNPDGKGVDFGAIVKKLGKMLRRNQRFANILPITSAKVPIVKMRHRTSRLEADISLYNTLGRRNSKLLANYAAIDPRVRMLGYMAKLLAKQCDIGDASRGTLSSYAYTMMVLYYLQQVNPPVIPVLQEIAVEGVDRSLYIVEERDTWFFDDLPNLNRVWPHVGENRSSPSVLWLGFLRFYAEIFNYEQRVVCIRQLQPLYRLEKMWTEKAMAIEDPFDLSHNLASGLSPRMGAFIRRVFVNALRVFQTPVANLPRKFTSIEEYLFHPRILAPSAPPPNDRGCNICGHIGHKAKDCDRNRQNRNKRREDDDDDSNVGSRPQNRENHAQAEAYQNGRPPAPKAAQAPRNHYGQPARQNNRPTNGQYRDRQRPHPPNWRDPRGPPPANKETSQ